MNAIRKLPFTVVVVIIVSVATAAAPVVYAQEQEAQIRSRCEANGGIYSTGFNANGDRVSQRCRCLCPNRIRNRLL